MVRWERAGVVVMLAAIGVGAGCGRGEAPPAAPSAPASATGVASAPVSAGSAAPGSAVAPAGSVAAPRSRPAFKRLEGAELEETQRRQRGFSTWLNEGRAAVQRKDYEAGIAALNKAREVRPDDPAVLGELGYAHYLRGERGVAKGLILRALQFERDPRRSASSLYNLGKIAEDEGQPDEALERYGRSLALRPNKTVQERYDALSGKGSGAKGTLDAVCAEAMRVWSCAENPRDDEGIGQCSCQEERIIDAGGVAGAIQKAALLKIEGQPGEGGSLDGELVLAVETSGGGWQLVTQLSLNYSPGVSYIHHTGELVTIGFESQGAGLPSALVVTWTQDESDGDYGGNSVEFWDSRKAAICAASPRLACLTFPVALRWGLHHMLDDEPKPEGMFEKAWSTEFELLNGKVSIEAREGRAEMGEEAPARLGAWSIDELGTKPGVALIPLR